MHELVDASIYGGMHTHRHERRFAMQALVALPPVLGAPGDVLPADYTRLRWTLGSQFGFDANLIYTLRNPPKYQDCLIYDVPETVLGHPHSAGFVILLQSDLRTVKASVVLHRDSTLRSGNRGYDRRRDAVPRTTGPSCLLPTSMRSHSAKR